MISSEDVFVLIDGCVRCGLFPPGTKSVFLFTTRWQLIHISFFIELLSGFSTPPLTLLHYGPLGSLVYMQMKDFILIERIVFEFECQTCECLRVEHVARSTGMRSSTSRRSLFWFLLCSASRETWR